MLKRIVKAYYNNIGVELKQNETNIYNIKDENVLITIANLENYSNNANKLGVTCNYTYTINKDDLSQVDYILFVCTEALQAIKMEGKLIKALDLPIKDNKIELTINYENGVYFVKKNKRIVVINLESKSLKHNQGEFSELDKKIHIDNIKVAVALQDMLSIKS